MEQQQMAETIAKKRLQLMNNKNAANLTKKFFDIIRQIEEQEKRKRGEKETKNKKSSFPCYERENMKEDLIVLSSHLDRLELMLLRHQRKNKRIVNEFFDSSSSFQNAFSLIDQNEEEVKQLEKVLKKEQTAKSEREQYDGMLHLLAKQRSQSSVSLESSQLKEDIDKLNREDQQLTERLLLEKKKFLLFEFATRDLHRLLSEEPLLPFGEAKQSSSQTTTPSSSSSSSSSKSVEIGDQNTRPLRSGKLNNPREREKKCFYVAASSLLKILLKLDPHHPAALHLASELEFVWGKEILTKIDFRKKRVNMDLVLKAADLFKRSIESRPELVSSLNSLIQASSMGEFVAFYYMYQMRNEPFAQAVLSRCTTAKDMNLTSLLKIPQPTFHSLLSLCTSLESVSLENVYQTVDETVEILCTSSHKTLRFLNLGGCFRLQVNSIKHINKMKRLQWLSLAYCDTIPFNGFMEFASNCPFSLETLDLSTALGANRITDEVIVNLARRLSTTLVSLKLSHCSQISDTALGALAKHCTNLTHLHLNRSLETADEKHLFSDKGVGLIARNHKLRYLDISFCSRLTERTLNSLYRCSELKTLNVEGCRKITQPLRERFMQNCPSVLVLPSLL